MHPFPLPAVDFQSQVLHLVLAELGPGLGLTASAAGLHPALAGPAVCSVFSAVRLEHLVGEEAPSRVIHHQVWGWGAAAGGARVGIHLHRKVGHKLKKKRSKNATLNVWSLRYFYRCFLAVPVPCPVTTVPLLSEFALFNLMISLSTGAGPSKLSPCGPAGVYLYCRHNKRTKKPHNETLRATANCRRDTHPPPHLTPPSWNPHFTFPHPHLTPPTLMNPYTLTKTELCSHVVLSCIPRN